jgi:hypothetical protein
MSKPRPHTDKITLKRSKFPAANGQHYWIWECGLLDVGYAATWYAALEGAQWHHKLHHERIKK